MTEFEKPGVKSKVEAILFSVGRRISLDDISKLSRSKKEEVVAALQELKREYDEKQSSLVLVEDGDVWKFTVRDNYMPIVRNIVTETELTKSVLETLAVIAFKYPVLQSDLIKIRTSKAYEHLAELEKTGYISRQRHGRTNLIKLTDKFFKYFDLTEDKLRDRLSDFESIANAINEKEAEIEKIKEEQVKMAEELKSQDERVKEEIELLDKSEEKFEIPLETYNARANEAASPDFANIEVGGLLIEKEKIGELEVVEEKRERPKKEQAAKEPLMAKDKAEAKEESSKEKTQSPAPIEHKSEHKSSGANEQQMHSFEEKRAEAKAKKKSEGIKLTPEMEAKVEQKVEEMLHPKS